MAKPIANSELIKAAEESPAKSRASKSKAPTTTTTTARSVVGQTAPRKQDGPSKIPLDNPAIDKRKRIAANARERKRMHLLNKAYDRLRKRLADAENKSKYDVLVQAKEYIQALTRICENFDEQHPNECPKMEPVQDTWVGEPADGLGCQQLPHRQLTNALAASQVAPLSPPTTIKYELSPPASSIMSPYHDDSCFSPPSQHEPSLPQPLQQQQQQSPAHIQVSTPDYSLNYMAQQTSEQRLKHNRLVSDYNSCSTLMSPPPTTTTAMHQLPQPTPPALFEHNCTHAINSFLFSGHYPTTPTRASSAKIDIYNQYYQAFYHIQNAT